MPCNPTPNSTRNATSQRDVHRNARIHTGRRYGRLTVVEPSGKARDGHILWKCLCDCGNTCEVQSNNFRTGPQPGTQSCGCLRSEKSSAKKGPWNKGITYQNHAQDRVFKNRKAWAKAVIRMNGPACQRCSWDEARCDVHHIIPRRLGGTNTVANGRVVCPNCHRLLHEAGQ